MDKNNFYKFVINMNLELIFILFFISLKDIQISSLIVYVILSILYTIKLHFTIMKLVKLELFLLILLILLIKIKFYSPNSSSKNLRIYIFVFLF